MAADICLSRAAGSLPRLPFDPHSSELAPLLQMGLPPKQTRWAPNEVAFCEGHLSMGFDGETFGDGSGENQDTRDSRIASWAVVRGEWNGTAWTTAETMRGNVTGWFQTVPRAELRAYIEHLRHGGNFGPYIGDCKMVVDRASCGVPLVAAQARDINADLWKEARRIQEDIGGKPNIHKTRAHRTRRAAEADIDDPLRWWVGNDVADRKASSLAKSISSLNSERKKLDNTLTDAFRSTMKRVAYGAAWAFRNHWPETRRRRSERPSHELRAHDQGNLTLHEVGSRKWVCRTCGRIAKGTQGLARLGRLACKGSAVKQVHATHDMISHDGISWCPRCGAFATRRMRKLLRPCSGAPTSAAAAQRLTRLKEGKPPMPLTTAPYLARRNEGLRHGEEQVEDEEPLAADRASDSAPNRRRKSRPALGTSCGRYLRLSGGLLARFVQNGELAPTDESSQRLGLGAASSCPSSLGSPIGQEASWRPSRRLRTKTSAARHAAVVKWCRLGATDGWAQRVFWPSGATHAPCRCCGSPSLLVCRGCRGCLCQVCAAARRPCPRPA